MRHGTIGEQQHCRSGLRIRDNERVRGGVTCLRSLVLGTVVALTCACASGPSERSEPGPTSNDKTAGPGAQDSSGQANASTVSPEANGDAAAATAHPWRSCEANSPRPELKFRTCETFLMTQSIFTSPQELTTGKVNEIQSIVADSAFAAFEKQGYVVDGKTKIEPVEINAGGVAHTVSRTSVTFEGGNTATAFSKGVVKTDDAKTLYVYSCVNAPDTVECEEAFGDLLQFGW